MYAQKLSDILADVRVDPETLGKDMAYQHVAIQERMFEMFVGFINELTIQQETGGFVNGNMDIAYRAWEIGDTLLTFHTQP